jgi:hypothetical protein
MFLYPHITKQAGGYHPGSLFKQLIGVKSFSLKVSTACFYRIVFCLIQPYSPGFTLFLNPDGSTLAQALTNSKANDAEL